MDKESINKLTEQIINAAFEVLNALGTGFLEKVYENALFIELKQRSIQVEQQVPIRVYYKENVAGEYYADLLVEDALVIELKVVGQITGIHEAQLLNYLKATKMKIGLILNFSKPKLEIKRLVNDL